MRFRTINLVDPRTGARELWGIVHPNAPNAIGPVLAYLRRSKDPRNIEVLPYVTRANKTLVDGADETPPPEPPTP